MKQIKEFFHKFAYKIEVFDPLDRPTPNEEEDVAIKRDQLVHKIEEEMPAMLGSQLIVPLNNEKYRKLEKLFQTEKEACNEIVDEYIINAQEHGSQFTQKLIENAKVKEFLDILEFFATHSLIRDSKKQFKEFKQHIDEMQAVIEKEKEEKEKAEMSHVQKLSNKLYKDMLTRKQERNFQSMSKILIDYHNIIGTLEGRTEPALVQNVQQIVKDIENQMALFASDTEQLFQFAFHLR